MPDDTRANLATATTGAGLVAGGGIARHAAVRQAENKTKRVRKPGAMPSAILRHGGLARQRLLWGAGATAGFAGATGLGVGVSGLVRKPKKTDKPHDAFGKADKTEDSKRPFWQEGFSGTADATKERARNLAQPKSPKAVAASAAVAGGAGALGSLGAHRGLDHLGRKRFPSLMARSNRVRPAVAALAGTAAAVGSLPASNKVLRHVSPGYESVPGGGVKRKKKTAKKPSTQATVHRSSDANFRSSVVPTDAFGKAYSLMNDLQKPRKPIQVKTTKLPGGWELTMDGFACKKINGVFHTRKPTPDEIKHAMTGGPKRKRKTKVKKYYGEQFSSNKKRAIVEGAAATPIVGGATGPAAAARLAPPGQQGQAAALWAGGRGAGWAAGAAGGAYGSAALARKFPGVQRGSEKVQTATNSARDKVASKLPGAIGQHVEAKPGAMAARVERMAGHSNPVVRQAGRAMLHAAGPLKAAPAAAAVGGYLGSRAGAVAGSQGAYSIALRNEQKRSENLSKGRRIVKADLAQPLTSREQAQQYKRKRRNLALGLTSATLGAAGTATFVGSLATKKPNPGLSRKLEQASIGTAIGGGTVGAASGFSNFGVQRRNLRDEKARLQRQKALPHDGFGKGAGFRSSAIGMRRTKTPGVLKPYRTKNAVVTKLDDRQKEIAGGTAVGGYLGSPGKPITGMRSHGALDRLRSHGPGTHDVSVDDLAPYRRGPGRRFGDRAHTASVAQSIKDKGWDKDKPINVHVFRDRAHVADGAHRLWGAEMLGQSHVPTNLVHHDTKAPRTQTVIGQRVSDIHAMRHRGAVARDRNMAGDKLSQLAAKKPTGWQADVNAQRSKAGAKSAANGVKPLSRWVHGRRMAIGATVGGGATALATRNQQGVTKIDTTMDHNTAQSYKQKYGLRGPLPKGLDRDEKMRAYEGRYVAAGGPKAERHQRRADVADRVTGGALGIGGAGALTELGAKHTKLGRRVPRLGRAAQATSLGSAGVGALSELYHRHEEHQARSYKSSPAGVAASALRRMRSYTPDD